MLFALSFFVLTNNSDECAKSRAVSHIIVSSSHEAAVCVCVRVKEREREREREQRVHDVIQRERGVRLIKLFEMEENIRERDQRDRKNTTSPFLCESERERE